MTHIMRDTIASIRRRELSPLVALHPPVRATAEEQRAAYRAAGERVPDNLRRGLWTVALVNGASWIALIAVTALVLRACGVELPA